MIDSASIVEPPTKKRPRLIHLVRWYMEDLEWETDTIAALDHGRNRTTWFVEILGERHELPRDVWMEFKS